MPASATAPSAWPTARSSAPPPLRAPVPPPPPSAVQLTAAASARKANASQPGGARPALRLVRPAESTRGSAAPTAGGMAMEDGTADGNGRGGTVATMSRGNALPTTLRPVNDPGSRGPAPKGNGPSTGITLATLDIDALVARAQRGDRWAFTELFRRHRGDVARLVYRMMGPHADMEDIVQEVFLQVHRSIGEFRGQAKFSTWLHRVTVNVVLMTRRAARSRPVLTGEAPTEYEQDTGLAPDEDAMRRRRIEAFRRLLDRLPEKKRTVFELHELEGRSPAEIAQIVDAPVLTVRTRLFYARREIEAMIRDEPALAQLADDLETEEDGRSSPAPAGAKPGKAGVEEAT